MNIHILRKKNTKRSLYHTLSLWILNTMSDILLRVYYFDTLKILRQNIFVFKKHLVPKLIFRFSLMV